MGREGYQFSPDDQVWVDELTQAYLEDGWYGPWGVHYQPLDEESARAHAEVIVHQVGLRWPPGWFSSVHPIVPEPAFHLSKERQRQLDKTGFLHCTECRFPLPPTMAYVVGRIVLCERCWREIAMQYAETFDSDILAWR